MGRPINWVFFEDKDIPGHVLEYLFKHPNIKNLIQFKRMLEAVWDHHIESPYLYSKGDRVYIRDGEDKVHLFIVPGYEQYSVFEYKIYHNYTNGSDPTQKLYFIDEICIIDKKNSIVYQGTAAC